MKQIRFIVMKDVSNIANIYVKVRNKRTLSTYFAIYLILLKNYVIYY